MNIQVYTAIDRWYKPHNPDEIDDFDKHLIDYAVAKGWVIYRYSGLKNYTEFTNLGRIAASKIIVQDVQEQVNAFNKPDKYAVAVNAGHIGDAENYSQFIEYVVNLLFIAGQFKFAHKLFLTDPLLMRPDGNISLDEFTEQVAKRIREE